MKHLLNQTCEIRPYLRQGGGGPLYGKPETRQCRMEPAPNTKIVYKNPSGTMTETVASLTMFCQGRPIPIHSQVVWDNREMRVVRCEEMWGKGPHHLEVTLE